MAGAAIQPAAWKVVGNSQIGEYAYKAIYAGAVAGVSRTGGMYAEDLVSDEVDYDASDYTSSFIKSAAISMGISVLGSAHKYYTWDRFDKDEKLKN